MNHKATFQTTDRKKLTYNYSIPNNPISIVMVSHGMGEYTGSYQQQFKLLLQNSIGYYAIDHRGYGESEGRRGHINQFDNYVNDLKQLYNIATNNNNKPDILFGHSLGGLIATKYILDFPNDFKKLILTAPAFGIAKKVPLWIRVLSPIMSFVYPTYSQNAGLPQKSNDPLIVKTATARWFYEIQKTQKLVMSKAQTVQIPTYIFHSTKDPLTKFEKSEEFIESIQSTQKELYKLDISAHDPKYYPNKLKTKIFKKIIDWIKGKNTIAEN